MHDLPLEIYPVAAIREIDQAAIVGEGVSGYTLMTRAATAALREILQRFPAARRWQVVCGAGNNGGDGFVVARLAAMEGIVVSALTLAETESLSGDALKAYEDFAADGGIVMPWSGDLDDEADLLVDAILGSGLERDVEGQYAAAVHDMNAHPSPIVALDIPTGVHGDSGAILGVAINAALTITFVGLKAGLFLADGPSCSGELSFSDLDIPAVCRRDQAPSFRRIGPAQRQLSLPKRARNAHKGDFGHVLVVGGGAGMPGAAILAGEAALRSGAGRVSLATHADHAAVAAAACPELMAHGIKQARDLQPLLEKADVVAFGPGLGQSDWATSLYSLLKDFEKPAVWDADALNLLAETGGVQSNRVLTPHPGEAATLIDTSAREVQADRVAALGTIAERYGSTVVLKGAGSLVSSAEGLPWISVAGNPGMAAPGMGDVLTGVIAALIAQGLDIETAAVVGVDAHACAGDLAAEEGERGMLASDLIAKLRAVLNP